MMQRQPFSEPQPVRERQSFSEPMRLPAILTVAGADGSAPDHWLSLWQTALPDCRHVELGSGTEPRRDSWVAELDRAIDAVQGPVVLVAHGLGCLAVAWWAKLRWRHAVRRKLLGAMLVAPPCGRGEDTAAGGGADPARHDFAPLPRATLPFPSLLVASRDDPFAGFDAAEALALTWGSQFVDAGAAGHLDAQSGLGIWEEGVSLCESLITSVADARRAVRARRQVMTTNPGEGELGLVSDNPRPLNWRRFLGRPNRQSMAEQDKAYFNERAEAELLLAQRASHPKAVRSHYLLAAYYLDLVHCAAAPPAVAREAAL
jgi:predicted alpha/beta hydrolase family esterase